jgi:hypothetical protein
MSNQKRGSSVEGVSGGERLKGVRLRGIWRDLKMVRNRGSCSWMDERVLG